MSSEVIQVLRQTWAVLREDLAGSEDRYKRALTELNQVRSRVQSFRATLPDVCQAAGVEEGDVLQEQLSGSPRSQPKVRSVSASVPEKDWRGMKQKDFAKHVLEELGDEAHVDEIAARMRELGYQHNRPPARQDQLEFSLSALPNQVKWVKRGQRPGYLRLV